MIRIPMVDLQREVAALKNDLMPAIEKVLDNASFIKGSEVDHFDENIQNLLGVKQHISCANGTDALKIALMALEIKAGDEVITSPFTFVATAETIAFVGATPVFTDIDPDTFLMNPDLIEAAITSRTKAIIPVHLFGQMADMDKIMKIAKKHNLKVIEDTAQAIAASQYGKMAGTIGDIGTISYFPSKNLGAYGDAGGLVTNDSDLAQKLAMIANHGSKRKYEHHLIGVNSRLDTMQAAILNVKFKYIKEWIEKRRQVAAWYEKYFNAGVIIPKTLAGNYHTYHQYTIRVKHREAFQKWLADEGMASAVYYPISLDEQPGFIHLSVSNGTDLSHQACKEVVSLPISPWITEAEVREIAERVNQFNG